MRGISDLDCVCLTEIFTFLRPLDLCSMRQCSKKLRNFVDDYFHSLYFVRRQWLDLTTENITNVEKILIHFRKLILHLKVREKVREPNLILDVIANKCDHTLNGLSLNRLHFYEIKTNKFARVFDNLEILELIDFRGNQKCIENFLLGHKYPNLTTLKITGWEGDSGFIEKFFMTKRNLKKLSCRLIYDVHLPLIALNASEIEELDTIHCLQGDARNVMALAQLRKLKRLQFDYCNGGTSFIALMKELSCHIELDMLGISSSFFHFTDEFSNALSHLTNLKELRLTRIRFTLNCNKSVEMLSRKLSNLESLMLVDCLDFPYRIFFASICKSVKLRTIYLWTSNGRETNNFQQVVMSLVNERAHSCLISRNPLLICLAEENFKGMKELLTQNNLKLLEKYRKIKILRANRDAFCSVTSNR